MDGSFACPECGGSVQIRGVAPGRQVRCGFCNRLLEVPYLPRATDAPWKRRRFKRPRWFTWAWATLAIASVAILAAGTVQFAKRQYQTSQERSINQLIESSRSHEAEGRLEEALIDLDAALDLAEKAGSSYSGKLTEWRESRKGLARRDAKTTLTRLRQAPPGSFPVGNWLNLISRAKRDPDLSPISASVKEQFQTALGREVGSDLAAARALLESGKVVASFSHCDAIADLITHMPHDKQQTIRSQTEEIVSRLVSTHGVTIEPPQGHFIFGTKPYLNNLTPVLVKAVQTRGYLPRPESSPWRDEWKHALYQLSLEVSEQFEGNYLSSANRLTRINATVRLLARGESIWHTTPTARSTVPLPKLPAYLSTRLAISRERSEEFERLLYENARGQIQERLALNLSSMPEVRAAAASGGR
jgi:hypothetical protein